MKKLIIIMIFLGISLPVWAMRPVEDSELSTVTGPNSLVMNTPDRARLKLHTPYPKEYRGIGRPLLTAVEEMCEAILYGKKEDSGSLFASLDFNGSTSGPRGYRDSYMTNDEFQSDLATGRDNPLDVTVTTTDFRYSLNEPIGSSHTMYYTFGSYSRSTTPIYYELKPYGGGEMRDYYIDGYSTAVHPNSWFDVRNP
jgi:hypothetical protein